VTGPVASYLGYQGRSNFPSKELAKVLQKRWQEHPELTQGLPLEFIVGDTWMIGNVIIHDPILRGKNIKPWIDADDLSSPWLKSEDKKKTALILINQVPKPSGVWWRAGHPPTQAVEIQWAILPSSNP
jgi:hypothetical protein